MKNLLTQNYKKMLNANQLKRMMKLGDYVRVFMGGKITFAGFCDAVHLVGNARDNFRLDSNGIKTGEILFDDIFEFEIYRKVNDEIRSA